MYENSTTVKILMSFVDEEEPGSKEDVYDKVIFCVLSEMGLSFLGILLNLLVVTTIRHHEEMQNSTIHLLLINLCFSNLLASFLVKPISAIYAGYSMSVGSWEVSLVFCSLFTLLHWTTLCILPFTLVGLSWILLTHHLSLFLPDRFRYATLPTGVTAVSDY